MVDVAERNRPCRHGGDDDFTNANHRRRDNAVRQSIEPGDVEEHRQLTPCRGGLRASNDDAARAASPSEAVNYARSGRIAAKALLPLECSLDKSANSSPAKCARVSAAATYAISPPQNDEMARRWHRMPASQYRRMPQDVSRMNHEPASVSRR